MALVLLASASGAPGVTTTALGLALVWHRPVVLVDADPVGGSALLAGYFQGTLSDSDAMVDLVMAHRDQQLGQALRKAVIGLPGTQVALLPGPRSHAQAGSLADLWPALAYELRALEDSGQDVIVDAGRLGMVHAPDALQRAADLSMLVLRSDLPSIAAARQWADSWSTATAQGTGARDAVALVVGPGRPYSASEVSGVLSLPVVSSLAWDPRSAQVLSEGRPARSAWSQRDPLVRSYRSAAAAVVDRLHAQSLALSWGSGR